MNNTPSLISRYSPMNKCGVSSSHSNSRQPPHRAFQSNGVMASQPNHNVSSTSPWNTAQFHGGEMPPAPLKCLFECMECHISKSSCEDLEVHIKLEHLSWLPFCCTLCDAKRPSDNQIREHTYSHHKLTDHTEYRYMDNPQAKSKLQAMTDQALSLAIQQMVARRPPPPIMTVSLNGRSSNSQPSPSNGNQANAAKRNRLHQILGRNISHEQDNVEENALNGLKAMVDAAANDNEDTNSALAKLFAQQKEDEVDPDEAGISSALLNTLKATSGDFNNGDTIDEQDLLKDVSTFFSVNFDNFGNVIAGSKNQSTPSQQQHSGSSNSSTNGNRRRTIGSSSNQCASKKRVLGQCSKCNKPVTAGARQMHLFFHLSKDHNIFRFRCKFPGCAQEHYRKDQMENHMSKTHGAINHELMEDRSVELYDKIQELSMELLGTLGNKPGPSAPAAQLEYNKILQQQEESRRRKRGGNSNEDQGDDEPVSMVGNPLEAFQKIFKQNVSGIENRLGDDKVKIGDRIEDLLECKLCHKMIINRTRGLHILHHARNDLGLIRYNCKLCEFKHERSQSVATHGKKSHDNEDCVLDTLNQYEDEIKSLWKACFGHEQLFTSESKKKNKPLKPVESTDNSDIKDEKAIEDSYQSFQSDAPSGLRLFTPTNSNSSPSKKSLSSNGGTPVKPPTTSTSSGKKKASSRRFGIRKPQSKKRRAEMAKLREMSMRIGGALYFKKRSADAVFCEECNTYVSNRLTHHAYVHIDADLYLCPVCQMGNCNRNLVIKHLKDFHDSTVNPVDNRSKFAHAIKNKIRDCFPSVFIDAPVPSEKEMEQLKKTLNLDDSQATCDGDVTNENDEELENAEIESDQEDKDDKSVHGDSDMDKIMTLGEEQDGELAEA